MKPAAHSALVTVSALVALAAARPAHANRSQEIEAMLHDFRSNPVEFMKRLPPKWDASGKRLDSDSSPFFTHRDIADQAFLKAKSPRKETSLLDAFSSMAMVPEQEEPIQANNVLGPIEVDHLDKMLSDKLSSGNVARQPWSADYWPIYQGLLARRYADPEFPAADDWKKNVDYVLSNLHSTSVDTLSPAEKYDLLVGDTHNTLTHAMINEGYSYYRRSGSVETWMGICHGWSPAALNEDRPTHVITVLAADGKTEIPFYPDDIKGLASLLWANAQYPSLHAGNRCQNHNPRTDANGRILDETCFDENPGSWHKAVVNRIGLDKRGFVMDAMYDYQVWNQPVYGYKFSLFNPQTMENTDNLSDAIVKKADFTKDLFKKYRSPNAAAFVGVAMDLTYVSEVWASHASTNSPQDDNLTTVRYLYDLELDKSGKIIGGEWYNSAHPDFLWKVVDGYRAESSGDYDLDWQHNKDSWDGKTAIPQSWKGPAIEAAGHKQPLARIVRTLILLSRLGIGNS